MSYSVAHSVQNDCQSGGYCTGTSTHNFTFSGNTTIGNLLFAAISYDNTAATTVTPSGLGTWVQIGSTQVDATNSQNAAIWYAWCTSAGTTLTITSAGGTVTLGASATCFVEFSSTTGFTGYNLNTSNTSKAFANTVTSTDGETSNPITTQLNDLVIASELCSNGAQGTISAGTGWTLAIGANGTGGFTGACGVEYQNGTGSSTTGTFTVLSAGQKYTVQMASFSAPIVPPTFRPQRMPIAA